jgi:stage III sporulation protein SpoIIIAA
MCRADVEPQAQEGTARLLRDIARSLADHENVDVAHIRIGPVDLGSPDKSEPTA